MDCEAKEWLDLQSQEHNPPQTSVWVPSIMGKPIQQFSQYYIIIIEINFFVFLLF